MPYTILLGTILGKYNDKIEENIAGKNAHKYYSKHNNDIRCFNAQSCSKNEEKIYHENQC